MRFPKLETLTFQPDRQSSLLNSFNISIVLWTIMTVLLITYNQVVLQADLTNWEILALPITGLVLSGLIRLGLLFKPINLLISVQAGTNALLAILIVLQTSGLNSSFLSLLIFIPILNQSTQKLTGSLLISGVEIASLLFSVLVRPLPQNTLFDSVAKFTLLGSGMLLLSYILDRDRVSYTQVAAKEQELIKEVSRLNLLPSEVEQKDKDLLQGILHNIREGVLVTDPGGKILLASRKALEVLKTSNSTILDKPINQVLPISDQSQNQTKEVKLELTTLDAEPITVSVNTDPLIINGQGQGKIYVIKDITLESSLEEMKLDFVATAAHQLRTPLTSLKGYLGLLSSSIKTHPTSLTDEEKLFLERLKTSGDRLHSLIENLLNVTRVERGMLKLILRPVSLPDLIQDCLSSLAEEAKQKEVQLILEKSGMNNIQISGDYHLLATALTNLTANAIEFNHPGGWVMLSTRLDPQTATIFVTDNGRGISPEAVPHLFTKFYRSNNTLTQSSNGIGLGLYIAKSIIEAHHGQISFNSLPGKGTTFSLTLPLSTAPVHQINQPSYLRY